jgi:transcriptional regulator with XRE-family HTH domain
MVPGMTTTIDHAAGHRLRATRERQGLSLLALATRAGASPTTLYGAERYGRIPRAEVRERIATAIGVPVTAIWYDERADLSR